jgi:ribosomal protein uL23
MTQTPHEILEYPISTEKAVREAEINNTLIFIVNKNATKKQVKWAIEKAFNAKVDGVRTLIDMRGRKKAYIRLKSDTPAVEVTTQLGLV